MNGDEQKFEAFLQGFEPRRPRPLPQEISGWHDLRRLTAASVILAAIAGSLWVSFRGPRTKPADQRPVTMQDQNRALRVVPLMSSTTLTRAALEDPEQFDAQMDNISRRTLPCFDRADSSLRALAKE